MYWPPGMEGITIRLLGPDDAAVLEHVVEGVFDYAIDPRLTKEFLNDPRHHIVVAQEDKTVVGFASVVHYIHPDAAAELFLNQVAVADTHQNRGIGRSLVRTMNDHGRSLGCTAAWVLTSPTNTAALRMYRAAGGEEESEQPVMVLYAL